MSAVAAPPARRLAGLRRRWPRGVERHAGLLLAGALALAWALTYPRTPDLSAQVYRTDLFHQAGFAIWDANWYAGHELPGYSLLFAPLAALLGIRVLAVAAVCASTLAFSTLVRGRPQAAAAGTWFGASAACDLWLGRVTFALGVAFAMGAALALARRRHVAAGVLAATCAAASPVAGLFLLLTAAAWALASRELARAALLGLPALAVAGALALLFGEGGSEPFPASSFAAATAAALGFLVLVWRGPPPLRAGGLLYVAAVLASLLIDGPMGSNVARLAVLLAGPLLLLGRPGRAGRWRRAALPAVLAGLALWTVWGPVRELGKAGDASTRTSYYRPLRAFLAAHLVPGARVEVPLTRSHWEATLLGEHLPIARGWERQLDTRYDGLFFAARLAPSAYADWLRQNAVQYVALPDVALDTSSRSEARLIRAQPSFLSAAWSDAHWRVYQVLGGGSPVSGPGVLLALARDGFSLRTTAAGDVLVRVHWTRYFTVTHGRGCVHRAAGGWTSVRAGGAATLTVAARFSLSRALGGGSGCG